MRSMDSTDEGRMTMADRAEVAQMETRKVIVTCSTGGWVFWFGTKREAVEYAANIRKAGMSAKIEK